MDGRTMLFYFASYALLLPSLLFCYLPVRAYFRYPHKWVMTATMLACLVLCGAATWVTAHVTAVETNLFALTVALAGYFLFLMMTDLGWDKLLFLFADAIALLSFPSMLNHIVESVLHPNGTYLDVNAGGTAAKWGMTLLLLTVLWRFLTGKLSWIVSEYHDRKIWRVIWILPAVIAVCNVTMIPWDYRIVHMGRVFEILVMLEWVLLCLLLFVNYLFLRIVRASFDHVELQRKAQFLSMQAHQYQTLKNHMEQTSQIRHDFRHSIQVIRQLADAGETEELTRYIRDYDVKLSALTVDYFCKNSAVNALLCYYAEQAQQMDVRIKWKVHLPQALPFSEVDICSVLGNLLENGIAACETVPPSKRYLSMAAQLRNGRELYITAINSFDGQVKLKNGSYLSTKHSGEGVGLRSIRDIAERCSGMIETRHTDTAFSVDVLLRVEP